MSKNKVQETNGFVKFLNIILVLITIFSVAVIVMLVYFTTWGKDKVPTALTTAYVTSITDPQTNQELRPMEVNVLSNETNNGKPMVEFLINSYTDVNKSAVIGIGFQLVDNELYYYNRTNSGSFIQVTEFDQQNSVFLVDIEEQLFALKLDGTYETEYVDGWMIARTVFTLGLNTLVEGTDYNKTETHTYTIQDFMKALQTTIISNSNGTGEGTISLVDVSQYISIYDATTNEQISNEELGGYGLKRSYFDVEYSYSKAGVNWATQSLFKSVAGDSDYNTSEINPDANYWQALSRIELNEDDFEKRTSAIDGKDYLYLTSDSILKMNLNTAVEIFITIDLDESNVAGFDYYALSDLKNIKKITISSSESVEFYILNNALANTNFDVENIETTNVVISERGAV